MAEAKAVGVDNTTLRNRALGAADPGLQHEFGQPGGLTANRGTTDMLDEKRTVKISKFLSMVLRHQPDKVGITLDEAGWVDVDVLLAACAAKGRRFSRADLDHVVANNNKKRFAYSDDGRRIRASQGHSVTVELGLDPVEPPDVLYHGTATATLPLILAEGLKPMNRQDVHLSADVYLTRYGKGPKGWIDFRSEWAGVALELTTHDVVLPVEPQPEDEPVSLPREWSAQVSA